MAPSKQSFDQVEVDSRAAWRKWLVAHHRQTASVWVVTYKKPDPRYLSSADVAEEALCFGWIDSVPRKLDQHRTMLLVSPRRRGSAWSKLNKDRARRLIDAGLMTAAGQAKIAAAQADGTWTKLDAVERLSIPTDLAVAFQAYDGSKANFLAFPRSAKRGILEWILQAKRPETRAKRIAETARMAAQNKRANQWRT